MTYDVLKEVVQTAEVEQLKLKLKGLADYDEIKRELEIMKVRILVFNHAGEFIHRCRCRQYVEFAGLDADADDDGLSSDNVLGLQLPNPNASKANDHQTKSLEALLATKNKRILEELTKIRVRYPSPAHKALRPLFTMEYDFRYCTMNWSRHSITHVMNSRRRHPNLKNIAR